MTATAHPSRRAGRRAARLVLALAALAAPAHASAYGWPLKPFDRQHAIRGFFGDPRGDHTKHSQMGQFHFGVDVSAADGSAVYATLTGQVVGAPHPDVVIVRRGAVEHSYWHVIPSVRVGQSVVAGQTRVGAVERPWGHVHFSEAVGGVYVNPLRRGALAPYADGTAPSVVRFGFERAGTGLGRRLRGATDLVAEVADQQPLAAPAPWGGKPAVPAVVRWRIVSGQRTVVPWTVAVDFRTTLPTVPITSVYAPWTRQNHPWAPGRYRVYLARGFRADALPDGLYRLEADVSDIRDNRGDASIEFAVGRARLPLGNATTSRSRPVIRSSR